MAKTSVGTEQIRNDSLLNEDLDASAAIAFSKLAALTDGNLLIGNGSNVATSVNPSGDIDVTNAGVFSISSGVIVDADVNASAALAFSKLAALTDGNILVGNGSNVAVSVSTSGDIGLSNAGVFSIASDVIVDGDVNSAAAIAGSKIDPTFGAQKITTTVDNGTNSSDAGISHAVSSTSTQRMLVDNTRNSDNTGNASMLLMTGGALGGDPYVQFNNRVQNWLVGLDNSDSDSFKVSFNTSFGTNDFLIIDSSGNTALSGTLTVGSTPTGTTNSALSVPYLDGGLVKTDTALTFNPAADEFTASGLVLSAATMRSTGSVALSLNNADGAALLLLNKNGGNVGVGQATAATALDVNGTVTATAFAGGGASVTGVIADGLKSATTDVDTSAATAPSSGQVITATSSTAATWQTPSGGGALTWTKFTVAESDFTAAATSESINLTTLAAAGVLHGVKIKQSTAVSGGSLSAFTVEVGISGATSKYASAFNVFQAVANDTFQTSSGFFSENHGATTQITVTGRSTGDNVLNATAGSVDIWLLTSAAA